MIKTNEFSDKMACKRDCNQDEDQKQRHRSIARKTTFIMIAFVVTVVISTSVLIPMIIKMTKDKSENGK